MSCAVLKRFEDDGRPEEDLPLLTWAMDDSLHVIQESLKGVLANLPIPLIGGLARALIFPLGSPYSPPSDATGKDIARLLTTESASRERLTAGVYLSDTDDASGRVHMAFHLALTAARAESAIRNALKEPVTFENHEKLVRKAVESGVITEEQATSVRLAQEAARAVIEVDEFSREEIEGYAEPAFRPAVHGE
jgi:acyl-CoA dehydrogenase